MRFSKWIVAGALAASFGFAQAAIVEGQDYQTLPKAMPQANSNQVEVLEFFGYFCIHCKNIDPIIRKHSRTFASDTYYKPVHVVWEPAMLPFARIASAVDATGMMNQANPAIYSAMFDQKVNLGDEKTFKDWAKKQTSFDGNKLITAYDSFNAQQNAKAMEKMTVDYQIDSTPTVIVGGKYKVIMRDFNKAMNTIDELVVKVRQENGLPAPQAKAVKAVSSKGAAAALAANQ